MGGLTSNGSLFLINQNGVLFGDDAQVNVGSLVASSMDISNADFLNGNYQFNANGSAAGVEN
jgi:large exoprotein involved in heme utilization and adhesion